MKQFSIAIAILLIFSHIALEFGELLEHLFTGISNKYIDPFLDPNYKFPIPEGIQLKWWVKYVCDDFLLITCFFALTVISYKVSWRLFRVSFVFFVYHLLDHFLLWWNYRSSHWVYWIMGFSYIVAILVIFIPVRNQGKLKSME
jgi:hypothetical protein